VPRKIREIPYVAEKHGDGSGLAAAPKSRLCQLTRDLKIGLVQHQAAQFQIT
jgi:hypothetical protein